MPEPGEDKIKKIYLHWDRNEELCILCEAYWKSLTTSQRREIRHNYDYEKD